jgi:pilus assembly protein CpaF
MDARPSPRIVSSPQPNPMIAPLPPAPMPPSAASFPRASSPPKSAHGALTAVVAAAARSFNPYEIGSPAVDGDPRRDAARRAVEAAVDAVARSGGSFDREKVTGAAVEEIVALGALGGLLGDHSAREILVQGPDTILVDRGQGLAPFEGYFSSAEALAVIVGRLVTMSGVYFDRQKAMQEGTLPTGVHFLAVLPPVAIGGPMVELRRTLRPGLTGDQLVSRGMLSNEIFELLRRAYQARRNIVVVGGADAGVGQLCSALANLASDGERVLTVEEVPNLELASPNAARLTVAPGATMDAVITQSGRMRADRVVIDGVRGGETLSALLQLSSRGGGCVLGVHSAAAADALDHLIALAYLGGGAPEAVGRFLPAAVQLLVRVGRGRDGRPRVESVGEVRKQGQGAQLVELFGANFASTGQSPSF